MLYLPIVWILGPGEAALRTMGTLWAVGGAVLLSAIAGELFGPRARLAGLLAALLMPPTWLGFSLMARGNYVEAAVLSLLGLYLLLLSARLPHGRRGLLTAAGLGWALGFAVWFWPSAWPPSLGLFCLALGVHARTSPRLIGAILAGIVLALSPSLLGFGPSEHPADPIASADRLAALTGLLTSPTSWPGFVATNLWSVPLLENWSPDLGGAAASGTLPDWSAQWQGALRPIQRALNWIVLGFVGGSLLRRPSGLHRATGAGMLGLGFGLPLMLGALGVGPTDLAIEQLYFFDPRRAALLYPLWALAWAGVFHHAWQVTGARKRAARTMATAAGLAALASVSQYAFSGPERPESFHPERYVICPEDEPRHEVAVCIGLLLGEHLPVLDAVLNESRLRTKASQRHLLLGFGSVELEAPPSTLPPEGPPEAPRAVEQEDSEVRTQRPTDPDGLTWEGVGLALGASCSPDLVKANCSTARTERLRVGCLEAAQRARENQ